jgi:hypothetical protein
MARIRPPTWTKRGLCPVCQQGNSLAFMACPLCAKLIIVCEEEGSVFLNVRDPLPSPGLDASTDNCSGCGLTRIADFVPASDEAIQSHGFAPADYE